VEAVARITALDPDPRYPEATRIEIDGVRFGAVPRELIAAERLQVGAALDSGVQDRLSIAADAEAAFRTMLRVLGVRSFARADLGRRLQRKGHPRAAIEAATERAARLGLLNDAAFVQSYVETRAARGRGPARLVRDLMAMGVERSLIDGAIASQWPEGSDRSAVPLALAHKRAAQLGSLPRQTKRRRLVAYLARRGFTGREITEMVERVVRG
jgi:regulatory protein